MIKRAIILSLLLISTILDVCNAEDYLPLSNEIMADNFVIKFNKISDESGAIPKNLVYSKEGKNGNIVEKFIF